MPAKSESQSGSSSKQQLLIKHKPLQTAHESIEQPPSKSTGQHVSSAKKESLESLRSSRTPLNPTNAAPARNPHEEKNIALSLELERIRALISFKDNRILELDEENFQFRYYINSLEQEAQRIKERLDQREKDLEEMYLEKEELRLKFQQLEDDYSKLRNMRPTATTTSAMARHNSNDDEDADLIAASLSGDEGAEHAMKSFVRVNDRISKYNRLLAQISTVFAKYLRSSNQTLLPTRPSSLRSSLSNSFSNMPSNSGQVASNANSGGTSSQQPTLSSNNNVNANKKRRTTRRSSQIFSSNNNNELGVGLIQQQGDTSRFSIEGEYTMATLSPNSIRMLNHQALKSMQQRIDMRPVPAMALGASSSKYQSSDVRNSISSADFDDVNEETEDEVNEEGEESSQQIGDQNIDEMTTEEETTANETQVCLSSNFSLLNFCSKGGPCVLIFDLKTIVKTKLSIVRAWRRG
jgi:hypothetical protein